MEGEGMLDRMGISGEEVQKQYLKLYLPLFCRKKSQMFGENVEDMIRNHAGSYNSMAELLKNIYYECYADLQMILLLEMTPEDYLKMFIEKENIKVTELLHDLEDMIRISTIYKVMKDTGVWKDLEFKNKEIYELVIAIIENNKMIFESLWKTEIMEQKNYVCNIESKTKEMVEGHDIGSLEGYAEIMWDLYEYLVCVTENAADIYNTKKNDLEKVQKIVKTVLQDKKKDILKIYHCIETEIAWYRKELFPSPQ